MSELTLWTDFVIVDCDDVGVKLHIQQRQPDGKLKTVKALGFSYDLLKDIAARMNKVLEERK